MFDNTLPYPYFYSSRKNIMKTNGYATVKAEPDIAIVNLGVTTENISPEAAIQENAVKSNAVIDELLKLSIPRREIRTSSFNIEPHYDYVDGKQILRGYIVNNIITINIKDLQLVGEIIAHTTAVGANRINNITLTVENPSLIYNQALDLAVMNSIQKAKGIASALGTAIDEIPFKLTEESTIPSLQEGPMLKAADLTIPILPGQISITARVEAEFNYMY